MNTKLKVAVCATVLGAVAAPAPALAAKPATKVFVRVEGVGRTLLPDTVAAVATSGSIRKGGAPAGVCPAASAAGAFDRAVHGHWTGEFFPHSASLGVFVSSIFGVKPPTKNDYWVLYLNGRSASKGMCQLHPKRGDEILFAIGDGSAKAVYVHAPATARKGTSITVTAGVYGPKGFTPASGVTVSAGGRKLVTGNAGTVHVRIATTGTLVLRATGKGYVRSPAVAVRELS